MIREQHVAHNRGLERALLEVGEMTQPGPKRWSGSDWANATALQIRPTRLK
jgi:hypothetical protein